MLPAAPAPMEAALMTIERFSLVSSLTVRKHQFNGLSFWDFYLLTSRCDSLKYDIPSLQKVESCSPECELNSRFQGLRQAPSDSACSVRGLAINSIVAPFLPSPSVTLGSQLPLKLSYGKVHVAKNWGSHVSEPHGDGPASPSQDLRWLAPHPPPANTLTATSRLRLSQATEVTLRFLTTDNKCLLF